MCRTSMVCRSNSYDKRWRSHVQRKGRCAATGVAVGGSTTCRTPHQTDRLPRPPNSAQFVPPGSKGSNLNNLKSLDMATIKPLYAAVDQTKLANVKLRLDTGR